MSERWSALIEHIGRACREAFDQDLKRPVPERWVTLIQRLDAEDDRRHGQSHRLATGGHP